MSELARDSIIDSIKALPVADQWTVMESALKALKNASKPTKAKKVRDPDAPKKKATWWVKRTMEVREHIKDAISHENLARKARGEKGLTVVHVRVTTMLRDAGKLTKELMPSAEECRAAWLSFLESPPPLKQKPAKEQKEPKEPKEKKTLTDEEKAAKKEARAAKKAAKSSEKAVFPPKPRGADPGEHADAAEAFAESDAESEEVAPYEWTFNFGKGDTVYERLDHEGKAYIYDNNTKAYLGLFMEKLKKLNKAVPDPLAA